MDSAKECFAQDVIYTMTNEGLMDVWNDYCDFSGREDKVYENIEENIEEMLSNLSKQEILTLGRYSSYSNWDDYVCYGDEEINTSDETRYLIDSDNSDFQWYVIKNKTTDQSLMDAFANAFLDNTTLDEEDADFVDVEDSIMKIYDYVDVYDALRNENWDDMIEEIDNLINEGEEE